MFSCSENVKSQMKIINIDIYIIIDHTNLLIVPL